MKLYYKIFHQTMCKRVCVRYIVVLRRKFKVFGPWPIDRGIASDLAINNEESVESSILLFGEPRYLHGI